MFSADDVFEEALAEITERYPSLRGNLTIPTMVYGHDGVGEYYPPDLVPELREQVEQAVDSAEPDDREDFERLLRVLRAAEARGLAYWEVTNLQVANANEDWLSESDNDHGL